MESSLFGKIIKKLIILVLIGLLVFGVFILFKKIKLKNIEALK